MKTASACTWSSAPFGTSGSIAGNVSDNGLFAVNRSDTYTFGGVISGTGGFAQIGTGTTILSGANTYSGTTTVSCHGILKLGSSQHGRTRRALVGSRSVAISVKV